MKSSVQRPRNQVSKTDFEIALSAQLKKHELKITNLRKKLLKLLNHSEEPLSQADIIKSLNSSDESQHIDRVSVYRNLQQLTESKIIHKLSDNKYLYCHHDCKKHAHIVFHCEKCDRHKEVINHKSTDLILKSLGSETFFAAQEPISVKGVCQKCSF